MGEAKRNSDATTAFVCDKRSNDHILEKNTILA